MVALTAADRAKLTMSGAMIPPTPKTRARAVVEHEPRTLAAGRTWREALHKARAALDALREAELAYIAACEAEKGRGSRRRMPAIDPYHTPKQVIAA